MFAVVRTGGKQYRVAPGDKIVVEKLDGNAGDRITLGEVLLAGDGSDLKSTDGLTVAAEIVAQAKADKVTVFKKRRRQNYRRKKGHRQQHTILKIVAIGDHKEQKKAAPKAEAAPAAEAPAKAAAPAKPAAGKGDGAKGEGAKGKSAAAKAADEGPAEVTTQPTENPAPDSEAQANPPGESVDAPAKPAKAKKPAQAKGDAETPSTKNAAPAKGGAKKSPKAK